MKLYTASKIRHVELWRTCRVEWPDLEFTSTWVDLVTTEDADKLADPDTHSVGWRGNVIDVLRSNRLLFYHREGEAHQGAFIEVGVALAAKIPVHVVSNALHELNSWIYHPSVFLEDELQFFLQRMSSEKPFLGNEHMHDKDWKIPRPREYLKIKYSAPTGTCKCGECQLVPPEMLMTWDAEIQSLNDQIKSLRVNRP